MVWRIGAAPAAASVGCGLRVDFLAGEQCAKSVSQPSFRGGAAPAPAPASLSSSSLSSFGGGRKQRMRVQEVLVGVARYRPSFRDQQQQRQKLHPNCFLSQMLTPRATTLCSSSGQVVSCANAFINARNLSSNCQLRRDRKQGYGHGAILRQGERILGPRGLGQCGALVVGGSGNWSSVKGCRWKQQQKRSRIRVRGAAGDGDDKESGASVTTEEKEPEAKEVNQLVDSTPSSSSSGSPPPGDGEELPIQLLPHAFSFVELIGPEKVDPEDIKILKEKVFGYTSFWITGQEPFGDLGEGVLLLGNLRGNRDEVFAKLQRGLKEKMGNKYDMFMVEEPNAEDEDPRGGPRVSFVLLRQEVSDTGPTTLWQYIVAIILFVLTGGTCLELGISSQLSRLPPEVVQYITNPETTVPPDLQVLVPYVDSALPLAYGVFGVQLFHELGHRLAAAPRNVKLGIPYFIPNITLGSFGAITQFKSICPDRTSKFDVSMAGPLAGGLLSLAMFGVGLILSTNPEASSQVVQVPSLLLQGSLLLGLVTRGALGYTALHATTVSIHPLVIAGWCGLTTTAFNLLPVGCLDGGRAIQAALGKTALNISGLITYLLLGLGALGGPLSLPWGLYIIIAQRSPEKPCLNDVSDVGSWRKGSLLLISLLVIATLLPVWDELAEELGIGIVNTLQVMD
ncbi:zinc metalloprotease EGY, chloroplastic [Marchantia polymorpha subsp. ruderalis]